MFATQSLNDASLKRKTCQIKGHSNISIKHYFSKFYYNIKISYLMFAIQSFNEMSNKDIFNTSNK